jgi:hypothetical protein
VVRTARAGQHGSAVRDFIESNEEVLLALALQAFITPPCIDLSFVVILYTKYTGWRLNDFNVHG